MTSEDIESDMLGTGLFRRAEPKRDPANKWRVEYAEGLPDEVYAASEFGAAVNARNRRFRGPIVKIVPLGRYDLYTDTPWKEGVNGNG